MDSFVFVALFVTFACANAGLLASPSARIIQGPSSRTTVVGPDGSSISSIAPGGQIITDDHPGVVAHTAPILSVSPLSYAAPALSYGNSYAIPSLSYAAAPALSYATHSAYSAPLTYASQGYVANKQLDTLIAGPSGTISTSKTVVSPTLSYAAAPALTYAAHGAYASPLTYASQGYVAQNQLDALVAGPSGTIATSKTVASPTVYAHSDPLAYSYGAHHGLYL